MFNGDPAGVVFFFEEGEDGFPVAEAFAYGGVEFGFIAEIFKFEKVDAIPIGFEKVDCAFGDGEFDKVTGCMAEVAHGKNFGGINVG